MTETEALIKMVTPSMRRQCWRGGIAQIHVTRACDKSCFGCTQGSNLAGKNVLMTPEEFETCVRSFGFVGRHTSNPDAYFGVIGVFGGNPSVRAGTRVFTTKGIFPIEDLEGQVFNVRNLHGQKSEAFCRLSGKEVELYRVTLRGGHEYYATAGHEWPVMSLDYGRNSKNKKAAGYDPKKQVVQLGKKTTVELAAGMRLPVLQVTTLPFGHDGDADDGFLAGWLYGDGWLNKCRRRVGKKEPVGFGLLVNADDHGNGIQNRLESQMRLLGSSASFRAVKTCFELSTSGNTLEAWLHRFGIVAKEDGLPLSVWATASEAFRKGFIDGLFSSDGNVEVSKKGYVRVRLTTSKKVIAHEVSELLGFYGIKTQIDKRERPGKFPNGKDYGKVYTSYTVSISNTAALAHFASVFPLTHPVKNARLQSVLSSSKHKGDVESDNIEIISVEKTDLREDVWDISVNDETHCFQLAHCVTGNCTSPHFKDYCRILQDLVPKEQCGLWSNKLFGHGKLCRETFNAAHSNLNVHLDKAAYDEFWRDWPESRARILGKDDNSRHSPPFVAMKDVLPDESKRWELIAGCDVNQRWSSMVCKVEGKGLRAFFCELAGAQAMLHAGDPNWPDLGLPVEPGWWRKSMQDFAEQVRYHCHRCGVPLRRFGQLAINEDGKEPGYEEVSETHKDIFVPKTKGREVRLVVLDDNEVRTLERMTDYIQNSSIE